MALIFDIFVICLGLCWGSFLNVCIYRLPKGQSILKPPSFCPKCGNKIKIYDNVPILSYILLGGKCRSCHGKISIVYPIVEVITAFICLLLFKKYGFTVHGLLYLIFCSILVVISFIDLEHRIIPDVLSIGGSAMGVLTSGWLRTLSFLDSFLGLLLGGGLLYLIAYFYFKIRKIEGMGGGDIKLLGMIGTWLGYKAILSVLLVSSFSGVLVGLPLMIIKKDRYFQVPFGPFLSGAAIVHLFWNISFFEIF